MLLFWVLIGGNILAQEPYRYLEVVIEKGCSLVKIRPEPVANKSWLENNCIKTVNFRQFITAEPTITQPEGFFLVQELNEWQKNSKKFTEQDFLNNVPSKSIKTLADNLANRLFGERLCNLDRDKFFLLWLNITRSVFKSNNQGTYLDDKDRIIQSSLTGVWVWNLIDKSWVVQDVSIFSLHDSNGQSVTLLIDAGANIMTKIMICPELYYKRKDFSYDLVNKSSQEFKNFLTCKK